MYLKQFSFIWFYLLLHLHIDLPFSSTLNILLLKNEHTNLPQAVYLKQFHLGLYLMLLYLTYFYLKKFCVHYCKSIIFTHFIPVPGTNNREIVTVRHGKEKCKSVALLVSYFELEMEMTYFRNTPVPWGPKKCPGFFCV